MGLATFRQGGGGSNGGTVLYRASITPITNLLYGGNEELTALPVIRSGVVDKVFQAASDTGLDLLTFSSLGVKSTVATVTFTTYLASSNAVVYHLNSADNCLYVLLYEAPSFRLIKVSDTTGVVTTIGAAFTPTTILNWPTTVTGKGIFYVETGTGHLQVMFNGYTHLINKTTGAIVSQDTVVSIGAYLAKDVVYVTQDGTVGITNKDFGTGSGAGYTRVSGLVSATYGASGVRTLPDNWEGVAWPLSSRITRHMSMVDSDKIMLSDLFQGATSNTTHVLYSRTEFDKYLKSIEKLNAGTL